MWTRKELKERAKSVLREIYWSAFGISIVIALAGGFDGFHKGGNSHINFSANNGNFNFHSSFINWGIFYFALVAMIIMLCLRIFVGYSLEIGGRRFFVQSAQRNDNKMCFRFAFDNQNYKQIVKTMFVTKLFIFLWTLLLIIPGIIKSYAYRMVPYILADNPNIGITEAISLSNQMTRGHKFDMFVLDLSFIGWYIVGAIALGIGTLFVMPYQNATNAELYLVLRRAAIMNGFCKNEDLLLNSSASNFNNNIW